VYWHYQSTTKLALFHIRDQAHKSTIRLNLDFLALNSMAASPAMIHRAHKQDMKV
jgi:hypothetical protein